MTDDMVERVALAISGAFEMSSRDKARAAIRAMREPTDAMIAAAFSHAGGVGDNGGHERGDPEDEWQVMIDSALGDL